MTATADIVVRVAENVVSVPNRTLRFAPPERARTRSESADPEPDPSAPVLGRGLLWAQTPDGGTPRDAQSTIASPPNSEAGQMQQMQAQMGQLQ